MKPSLQVSDELHYLLVVVGLFIVPRLLQRLRVPSAVTCLALGALLNLGFGLFQADGVVPVLATLGIVALFLFAGLEVDFAELRRGLTVTLGHLLLQVLLLVGATAALGAIFALALRPAFLLALAIFTPSTGFILDSLSGFGLSEQQQFWVKTKAIASELVALAALFFVVQSTSLTAFATSSVALVALVLLLPRVFQVFATRVLPFAPKSEFAFLLILALVSAYLTRHLGVYYLVGAFVVGVTAVRMRKRLPALASDRLLVGIELFASFFIPFYFFKAGLHFVREDFALRAVLIGLCFTLVAVPLRVGIVAGHRRLSLKEPLRDGARVGLSLVPTLVFSLVLADILRDRYQLEPTLYGALIVFALVNTALPGFLLRATPPDFVKPEAPRSIAPPGWRSPSAGGADLAPAPPAPESRTPSEGP
jgi:Kef-type K+ transport system membrane component KefB